MRLGTTRGRTARAFSPPTLVAALAAALAALAWPGDASAEVPVLERGDRGSVVRFYQDELNSWLRIARPEQGRLREDGVFGPRTEAATRDLERAAGVTVNGVAERETWDALYRLLGNRAARILRDAPVTAEWPIPVPQWFWAWARWYLGRGEFAGQARSDAVRPEGAPVPIPEWAWRRINALVGRPIVVRADHFVEDRVQAIWGARLGTRLTLGEVTVTPQGRSELVPAWILLTATFETVHGERGQVAAWLRLVRGRWAPWEIGRLGSERLNLRPDLVPCDLKPVFAEAVCSVEGG